MRDELAALPPEAVLGAFGAAGPLERLAGGQGQTFRAGGVVLKRAGLAAEAELTGGLFERLGGPGFRVPRPVRALDGRFVQTGNGSAETAPTVGRGYRDGEDGWCAWEYVDAEHAGRNGGRWPETIAACRAFHDALAREPAGAWQGVFAVRSDPWSAADRLTFGEAHEEPLPAFEPLVRRLTARLRPLDAPSQLIHGDFTANVLFADGEPPCVIDFSPYWRPAAFALGVVVADAVAWAGADPVIKELCGDVADFEQWIVRGLLRRVWECEQHTRRGRDLSAHVFEYERAATELFG